MTAAEHLALAAELRTATLEVQGATEQVTLTGLTFDYNAPLPPLNIAPRERLWEPAAVGFRDPPTTEEELNA